MSTLTLPSQMASSLSVWDQVSVAISSVSLLCRISTMVLFKGIGAHVKYNSHQVALFGGYFCHSPSYIGWKQGINLLHRSLHRL